MVGRMNEKKDFFRPPLPPNVNSVNMILSCIFPRICVDYLREHAATNLNICCTVFSGMFFRFRGEHSMHTEPFKLSNGLLGAKTVYLQH